MSSQPERWVVWTDSPHHYCHDESLFVNLTMDFPPPDPSKPIVVLGKGEVVIAIKNHPKKITSIRLKDVYYYKADGAKNYINLKMLQEEDYPELMLGKMKIDKFFGTGIVHSDDPERILLEVDEFDEER